MKQSLSFTFSIWHRCLGIMLMAAVWIAPLQAAIETYQFDHVVQEKRFQSLTAELRCPKCQNQNIADSNAPIAKDMRAVVYKEIKAGLSDKEIVDGLVNRFGDFVLYKPPLNRYTFLLWFAPLLFVLIGLAAVVSLARRAGRDAVTPPRLSAAERERLARLLSEDAASPAANPVKPE